MTSWTPAEGSLFAELARRSIVVRRGGEVRTLEVALEPVAGEVLLTFDVDEGGAVSLEPPAAGGHRWRSAWTLGIARGDEVVGWLTEGGAPLVVEGGAFQARMRVARRGLTRRLDGEDEVVRIADAAFHRYTRQSSEAEVEAGPVAPWAAPTAAEDAPWWELDLGATMYLASIRVDVGPLPPGTRLALAAYGFVMPSGAPPPVSTLVEVEDARVLESGGVVARFVRVTAVAPVGTRVALAVTAAEVLAAELYDATLAATMRRAFALHAARPLVLEGGGAPALRYDEVWTRAMALARGLAQRLEGGEGRVALAAALPNGVAWVLADQAAIDRGYVFVPLAPGEPGDRLGRMLELARPTCVIATPADAARIARLAGDHLRLVVVDGDVDGDVDAVGPARVGLEALIAEGAAGAPSPAPVAEDEPYSVLFTSGSTGLPRGAVRTFAGFHAMVKSYGVAHAPRHLSYQPLSHLSERMYLPALLVHGGSLAFSRGGAHVLDELRALGPTTINAVPRLFEVLYAEHQRRLRAALAAAPDRPRAEVEASVLAGTRAGFGPRLCAVSVGSAPVGAEVLAFLRRCFADVWVTEGYGSTEVGTIAFDGKVLDTVDVELRPVAGEAATGARLDRGEIWVRSPHVIAGYLGDPEATRAAIERSGSAGPRSIAERCGGVIDDAGYFATGDLGERGADGRVRVVGRVRNTVKLAQGEFVAPERIESALASAAIVDQVYVHAAPGAVAVAALVVPRAAALARALAMDDAASAAIAVDDTPLVALVAHPRAPAAVLAAVRAAGRAAGLAAHELPRAVALDAAPFTAEDGRLTVSGKLARGALAARHGAALAALVTGGGAMDVASGGATSGAHDGAGEASLADDDLVGRVVRVAARVLGRVPDPREPLAGAGVDSLAAAELLGALADELGREVPLAWWFEARTLEDLAGRLARFDHAAPAEAAAGAQVAADLALPAPAVVAAPPRPIATVLLTGATGFLGAHLVEALRARGLRVLALVRAPDSAAAAARLAAALEARAIPLAVDGDAIAAVAADLAAPELGLAAAAQADLAVRADAVLHAGAVVSWLAPYAALRGPNVHGTAALLALAASRGLPFHHVSTISTAPPDGDEDSALDLRAAAAGTPYALSKWVAEQHVRRAASPHAIYRPAMIAGHTARGTGNPDDFLHRYTAGLVELGLYLDRDDAIVDMTPVDFVAAAIAALLVAHPQGGATHHLANVDQSPSHAALGRALVAAGHPLRPAGYAELRAALARAPSSSRLRPLAAFFPETFALAMGPWPCARTTAALAALGVTRPRIDDAILARYIAAL